MTSETPAGYSGTPLARKLGIKAGTTVLLVDAPKHYAALVAPLPEGATLTSRSSAKADIVHIFSTKRAHLEHAVHAALGRMSASTALWVSWPKKASRVTTDITEHTIRDIALPVGLVDIKVCAVDETWSGLKLVIRKVSRA